MKQLKNIWQMLADLKSRLHWLFGYIGGSKNSSLLHQYIYYSAIVIIFTITTCVWITYSENKSHEEEYNMFVQKDATRLSLIFDETMKFTENIASMLAFKFIQSKHFSTNHIDFMIEHQREDFFNDAFSWNIFHYVTPEGKMVLNGGENKKSFLDLNKYQREWLQTAKDHPFTLQFSKPGIGALTKKFVLSSGYGFTDKKGEFKGYISIGIDITKLVNMLKKTIAHDISFILLDKDMDIAFSSDRDLYNLSLPLLQLNKLKKRAKHNSSILATPIEIQGYFFNCVVESDSYPFTFLVGQSKKIHEEKIRDHVIPQILRNMTMGIIFASVLLFVGYQALHPILSLSRAADNISRGKSVVIQKYSHHELDVLAKQLTNISTSHKDLRSQQSMLTKANSDLHNANEFIRNNMSFLSHELKNPVSSILGFAKMLQDRIDLIGNDHDKDCIDLVYSAAVQQDKQIDFFLRLFKFQECGKTIEQSPIDLRKVIFSNVNMVRHHAVKNNVSIEVDIDERIHMMLGDEIMIGQIVQNFAANGAKYSKRNGKLFIKVFPRTNSKKKKELVLEFIDNGIGIKQEDLLKLFKKFKRIENEKTSSTFGYGIGLNYAKSCVTAHDGTVQVKSKVGVGSVFTVIFPSYRILS